MWIDGSDSKNRVTFLKNGSRLCFILLLMVTFFLLGCARRSSLALDKPNPQEDPFSFDDPPNVGSGNNQDGAEPSNATLTANPTLVNFGPVEMGAGRRTTLVSLSNTSPTQDIAILGVDVVGGFSLGDSNCPATLAPARNCQLEVRFEPAAPVGPKTGTLNVRYGNNRTLTVSLAGETIESTDGGGGGGENPQYSEPLLPTSSALDYGPIGMDDPNTTQAIKRVNLRNPSNTKTIQIVGTGISPGFEGVESNCPASLGPGNACFFDIRMLLDRHGPKQGTFVVSYNQGQVLNIPLSGYPVAQPRIETVSTEINLGNRVVYESQEVLVPLTNVGAINAYLNFGGFGDGLTATEGCHTIAAGATCHLRVHFNPDRPIAYDRTVTIQVRDDYGDRPGLNVRFLGNGIVHLDPLPASADYGPIGTEQPDVAHSIKQFTLRNNSATRPIYFEQSEMHGPFAFVDSDCANPLLPGTTCAYRIKFLVGQTHGHKQGYYRQYFGGGQFVDVHLFGLSVVQPRIDVQTDFDFGKVAVGRTSTRRVTLRNTGAINAFLSFANFTDGFSLAGNCDVIGPGQECAMDLRFAPSEGIPYQGSGSIAVRDDYGDRPGVNLRLRGNGKLTIVATGMLEGGNQVRVRNGVTDQVIGDYSPFGNDSRGVYLAAGDLNGDGSPEIVASVRSGVSQVKAIDLRTGKVIFERFSDFAVGATVAIGDVNGDGWNDIIVGPGPGGGPHIRIYSVTGVRWTGELNIGTPVNFFASEFGSEYRLGVRLAAGNVSGDDRDEIIVGAGVGGGPRALILDGVGNPLGSIFVANPSVFPNRGANVAAGNVYGDGYDEIIGLAGIGESFFRVYNSLGQLLQDGVSPLENYPLGLELDVDDLDCDGFRDYAITFNSQSGFPTSPIVKFYRQDNTYWKQYWSYDPSVGYEGGLSIATSGCDD